MCARFIRGKTTEPKRPRLGTPFRLAVTAPGFPGLPSHAFSCPGRGVQLGFVGNQVRIALVRTGSRWGRRPLPGGVPGWGGAAPDLKEEEQVQPGAAGGARERRERGPNPAATTPIVSRPLLVHSGGCLTVSRTLAVHHGGEIPGELCRTLGTGGGRNGSGTQAFKTLSACLTGRETEARRGAVASPRLHGERNL